jgi:hypothetical protein
VDAIADKHLRSFPLRLDQFQSNPDNGFSRWQREERKGDRAFDVSWCRLLAAFIIKERVATRLSVSLILRRCIHGDSHNLRPALILMMLAFL